MQHFRLHIIPIIALFSLIGGSVSAQNITIDTDRSRLWIEGQTNVNQFSCRASSYDTLISSPEFEDPDTDVDVEVDIEVEGFDCGKRRMNRDLYNTLLSDRHPYISFEYSELETMTYDDSQDLYNLIVKGYLTVAGHKKEIEFPMQALMLDDGTLKATGQTELRMTDYNVEPPRALLGMVRVDDLLRVHFELYATTRNWEPFDDEQNKE